MRACRRPNCPSESPRLVWNEYSCPLAANKELLMDIVRNVGKPMRRSRTRVFPAIAFIGVSLLNAVCFPAQGADSGKSSPIKIAVFDFELDDVSPAASATGVNSSSADI